MTRDDDFDLRPRLGRPRARSTVNVRRLSFPSQVLRAAAAAGINPRRLGLTGPRKSGRFNARGRGAKLAAGLPRDIGWGLDVGSGMRFRNRRVVVKARIVKIRGTGGRAAGAHLRYLQRDGVTPDGARGRLYAAITDDADGARFLERSQDDRHQFRLIVAPEDAAELGDLQDFTRRLMMRMERDLDTPLDWVAVDHFNTGHPHSHIVIRGVTSDGKALNIAGDYIAHGIRHRASEILTLDLGPQSEWEAQRGLTREMTQERFTRLDRALLEQAGADRVVELPSGRDAVLLTGRLKMLERLRLAKRTEPARWKLSAALEPTLREMAERGDIIKRMHRAVAARGLDRDVGRYALHIGKPPDEPIIGRLIGKGLSGDELADRLHVVIDGIDGRVHYLEVAGGEAETIRRGAIVEAGPAPSQPHAADRAIAKTAEANDGVYRPSRHLDTARATVRVPGGDFEGYVQAHIRRLEALRRAGVVERLDADHWRVPKDFERRALAADVKSGPKSTLRLLSAFDLDAQVTRAAATWLDRALIGTAPIDTVDAGFGHEVRRALTARMNWLVDQELARAHGPTPVFRRDLLATLERRELVQAGRELAAQRGHSAPFRLMTSGDTVRGIYRQTVDLASGRYALIENAFEFTLVPWRPVIEPELGKQVSGLMRGADISWELGRHRGLGL